MGWTVRFLKINAAALVLALGISSLVGALLLALVLYGFANELPKLSSAEYRPRQTTKIFDRNGGLLAELHTEVNRDEIVPITDIPVHTRRAFVSIEDDQFYEHYGVRPDALVRAVILNLVRRRKGQGGSTITMQLARNRFLTLKKTYTRKLKELIMSVRLELNYTKDEILEQYLNEIFFGGNLHGIGAACRYYFGKPTKELDLAESSILAGILPAPNRYNPIRHFQRAKDRQKMVLNKMFQLGYISAEEAKQAYAQKLVFGPEKKQSRMQEVKAPYFVDAVTRKLIERFGVKRVYGGGLKVYTTLDPEIQSVAETSFQAASIFEKFPLEEFPDLQGGFLALDPMVGAIRGMIGGRDFRKYKYNRALLARRQPGSSFKTFVFAEALSQGIQPNAIINDEPIRYVRPDTQEIWEPQNSTGRFHGPVILSQALEQSYNIVAVKLLEQVGISNVVQRAKKMGIRSPLNPDLALALGASEATLLEMCSAYGSIANEGIYVPPYMIERIEDDEGNLVHEHRIQEREVLDPKVAYQLSSLLEGVVQRGTGFRTRVPGYKFAGKTGTTQNKADAWFIGFTPDLVVGANVGFDTRKTLGKGGTGGSAAGPIIGNFNKEYLTRYPPRPMPRPDEVDDVEICKDSGFLPLQGCKRRQTLPFIRGRAPADYCHLHESVDFRFSAPSRRVAPAPVPVPLVRPPAPVSPAPFLGSGVSPAPSTFPRSSGGREAAFPTPPPPPPSLPTTPDVGGELDLDLSF